MKNVLVIACALALGVMALCSESQAFGLRGRNMVCNMNPAPQPAKAAPADLSQLDALRVFNPLAPLSFEPALVGNNSLGLDNAELVALNAKPAPAPASLVEALELVAGKQIEIGA